MKKINVNLKTNPYPVIIGSNILNALGSYIKEFSKSRQIAIITSEPIYALYGEILKKALNESFNVFTFLVPDGEKAKSHEQTFELYTGLLKSRFERGGLILAFGGGVVGDLAGFIAATYLRGVELVQVPTTLLAQVDSSIGGKVGINHPLGKNLIGAFKQPLFVFSDINVLQTLEQEELRCGLGEVIKYGFIGNMEFFEYLELNLKKALDKDSSVLTDLVMHSSSIKADVVSKDEKESGLRMILNFGHTFGHALETELQYSGIKHGEAVILGMKCALEYSYLNGFLQEDVYNRGLRLLEQVPIKLPGNKPAANRLIENMTLDKKVKDDQIRLVLINDIGRHFIHTASKDSLQRAWEIL